MRHNVYVNIPISANVSYSLFAQGMPIDIPHDSEDGEYIIFKFLGGTVFALFYTFGSFRRAYLATAWQNEKDGEPFFLPGIDTPLYVLLKAKGKKIDHLKHALYVLTRTDHFAPFRLSINFWKDLSKLIEYKGSYKEEVIYIYNKYAKKGKKIK